MRQALTNLDLWVREGIPAPHAQGLIEVDENNIEVLDENNNCKGGFRFPQLDVPVAKSHSTLPGVVGNGIGNKSNPAFPCYLFHNLCLSDSRRAHKKDRSLSDRRDPVLTEFVL